MRINLRKVEEGVRDEVLKQIDDIEINSEFDEDGNLEMNFTIELKGIKGSIYVNPSFYPNGNFEFRLVFDEMEINETNLEAINEFNNEMYWFKACINKKGYLVLNNSNYGLEAEIAIDAFSFYFSLLTDQDYLPIIKKLTNYIS